MTEVMERQNTYLTAFERIERELAASGTPGLHRLRKAAMARFMEMGFPGPRDEEWRFTPIAPLTRIAFEPVSADRANKSCSLRIPRMLKSAVVCSLSEVMQRHAARVEPHLARHADWQRHPFVALNTAFLRGGAFVYVPPGTVIDEPLFLDFLADRDGDHSVWHHRSLIILGENSQVTLVENYTGPQENIYLSNAVTEIVVGPGAHVDHYKVQREGEQAFHMGAMQVQVGRDAKFSSHAVTQGGQWVRNEINAVFEGEGGECILNGLYQASGQQLVDNHTFIDHAYPHCASHELYKGILDGKARGVFNGKIYVRQDAQKTDAKQTNQTLLLSDDATINTKPQLEIYADDVKCTHGATVGQLDAESIFYLRSRGIGAAEARSLLTYAFANDIVSRIKVASVREELERSLLQAHHLPAAETAEEEA
ncbi:MAG TPA: Fe-S cluster assembly protein SufD [Gemmataceae bacterium]|nr:Fe-S cluster assembly protein SufD [Gemmataceae bacterium]